jgi:SAM-dependent methyltransferase
MKNPIPLSRHRLYELGVQSPRWQVDYLPQFHRILTGRRPLSFREDFCGTARIACEWVSKSRSRSALAIDIDPEVLDYAESRNRNALKPAARKRIEIVRADVLKPPAGKFDWIGAFNFSIYIFHERRMLLRYLRNARRSLSSPGTLFLELAGGPGFVEPFQDQKILRVPGLGSVTQIWEQHGQDPISSVGDYSIHYGLPSGEWLPDAFSYHWRIWSIREVRELLAEAGFSRSVVLWEKPDPKGRGSGEFEIREDAPQVHSWVAYVVGIQDP